MEVKPYTYLLINDTSWYIGVRCANKVQAEQDVAYMSSSKYVANRIKSGEVFTKHILGEYETKVEASKAEDAYLREHWDIPGRINKSLGFNYEFDDEVRSKLSASTKKANARPEIKAARSAASKIAHARPEVKAKHRASQNRPEVKAKLSASAKKAQNRPEVKAKLSAASKIAQNRPEVRAKKSAAKSKPCTIDGATIYQSKNALISELGQGKSGYKHPDFRYVQKL